MTGKPRPDLDARDPPLAANSAAPWHTSALGSQAHLGPFTAGARPHRELGDPLDAVANLFEAGVVLALGFLLWGLVLGGRSSEPRRASRTLTTATGETRITTTPERAQGRGVAVGRVYRLSDGRLVLVRERRAAAQADRPAQR